MKYNIDEIVQRMDKERPRSNIRGVKPDYEAIARKWCKVMPWTAARLSDESGPETRLQLKAMRETFGTHKYTKGVKRIPWFTFLSEHYPLWDVVKRGYWRNRSVRNTQIVRLGEPPLLELDDCRMVIEEMRTQGDEVVNQVVDRDSLESYIEKTMGDLSRPGNSPALHRKLSEILHQATQILKVLQWSEESQTWYFEVAQSKSEFGRTYQKGINLQIVPENLRIAALGDICSIDIENSVWQYYHHLGEALGLNVPLQLMYLLGDKKRFRRSLAAKVYPGMKLDDDSPEIKYVKRALTVIGFGGTARDIPGVRTGVKQCIMNDDARQRFFASDEVREIQGFVDNLLSALKKEYGNSNQFKGQSRWRKYLAYQYQQFESKLREAMVSQLHDMGMVVLLQVHDGVYAWGDRKPVDIKCAMSRVLESEYGGRSYKVGEGPRCEVRQFKTHKDLEAFWAEVEREEREHKERIKAEEKAAKERMRAKRAEAGNRIADTGPSMPAYDDGRESAAVAQARNRILEDNMLREMQRAELEQWKEFL